MTRSMITLAAVIITLFAASMVFAQDFGPGQGTGECQFIDEDGDGFNDLAPDADGDGIPNGMDDDYVRPQDGTGNQFRYGSLGEMGGQGFGAVGNDLVAKGMGSGNGYGLGDGTGSGVGPGDGTGFGPGTGECLDGADASTSSAVSRRGGRR
jgi:hypothetical protein